MTAFHDALREAKKQLILNAFEQAQGNYTEAAQAAGPASQLSAPPDPQSEYEAAAEASRGGVGDGRSHSLARDWDWRPVHCGYDIQVLPLLAELFDHQAWADATLLEAVRACPDRAR